MDLQKLVHEDMKRNFGTYPEIWGLKGPDRNIDHRRVPNQEEVGRLRRRAPGCSGRKSGESRRSAGAGRGGMGITHSVPHLQPGRAATKVWGVSKVRIRRAGMLVPVWSLRREGALGIGDTAALRELVDWAAECGLGFLQLLPINETGRDHSPYEAISSVALEPALLDLGAVPEITAEDLHAAREAASPEIFTTNFTAIP